MYMYEQHCHSNVPRYHHCRPAADLRSPLCVLRPGMCLIESIKALEGMHCGDGAQHMNCDPFFSLDSSITSIAVVVLSFYSYTHRPV